MLILKDVTRIFNNNRNTVTALDHVSLTVKKGDMISIMGPSGSGKSTLLHIIGCLDIPTSGSCQINNMDITTLPDKERARLRNRVLGFVLQEFALIEEETVLENVAVPLMFGSASFFKIDTRADEMLKLLKIESFAEKKVNMLSGGEKQRVAIARALVNNPDIILADEPTGNLDSKTTRQVMDIFINLNKMGKTIIISTHDPNVAKCCFLQYRMLDGKLYQV